METTSKKQTVTTSGEKVVVKIKKLVDNAVIPFYAHDGDMGMDLVATSMEYDEKHDYIVYHTGIAVEIPKGYGGFLFPRSSVCKKTLDMANCVGVIDSDYRGEVSAVFRITNPADEKVYSIGERCCQMVVMPVAQCEIVESDLSETARGACGYGSTGK